MSFALLGCMSVYIYIYIYINMYANITRHGRAQPVLGQLLFVFLVILVLLVVDKCLWGGRVESARGTAER